MIRIIKLFVCFSISIAGCFWCGEVHANDSKAEEDIKVFLNQVYEKRAEAMIHQNDHVLEDNYLSDKASINALHNEKRRIKYINSWAGKRSIKLVDAKSEIKIVRVKLMNEIATVSVVQSLKVSYDYLNKIVPVQSFGIGTRHFMTLKKANGEWMISREWYLDPLDENPDKIAETEDGAAPSVPKTGNIVNGKRYKRQQAIAYADKYAGTAWGAGNNRRYNPDYKDYTGRGGDCTNFASQVVGDKRGGSLPMTSQWRYNKQSGGTQYWVRTDSFKHFLLNSGYGKQVFKGGYEQVVKPTKEDPNGALARLQPGDLIGYIIHGNDIDHFSVLVGYDEYGYPLVNSHTTDRYRVPFDLGWDRNTKYVLVHIKD